VKQFKGLSSLADVRKEASILTQLSHPGIPLVFGISSTKPYLLILNFYSVNGQSYTLRRMLHSTTQKLSHQSWIQLLIDLIESLLYIHSQCLIHRDLKSDNIVISYYNNKYYPVIIDFGKCTKVSKGFCKILSAEEQLIHRKKYPHIAPEIVSGFKPSFSSDIYSLGLILSATDHKKLHVCLSELKSVVKSCTEVEPCKRIGLLQLSTIIKSFSCKC
jgi:serine/threonine protein kinase